MLFACFAVAYLTHIEITVAISINSPSLVLGNNTTEITCHLIAEASLLLQVVANGALLAGTGHRPAFDTVYSPIFVPLADQAS